MSLNHILIFLGAALLVTLSPGPDILSVITRSAAQGVRAGLVATAGFATGLIYHTAAAAVGLTLILRNSPTAFGIIKYAGAAYLVYIAVRIFQARDAPVAAGAAEHRRLWRIFGQSILMNVLNPKVTLFFFVFLLGFVQPGEPAWHMVVYGALFAGCTLLCFGTCAVAAGWLTEFLRRKPATGKWLNLIAGCVFIGMALWICVRDFLP